MADDATPPVRKLVLKPKEITPTDQVSRLGDGTEISIRLMHKQNEQPRIDIIGARQTIDTLSLLAEKTRGNLTSTEENFLQNSLYEVRMAYVEVTNELSRSPQPGAATGTSGR